MSRWLEFTGAEHLCNTPFFIMKKEALKLGTWPNKSWEGGLIKPKGQELTLLTESTENTSLALSKHWDAFCLNFKEAQGRFSCALTASPLMTGPLAPAHQGQANNLCAEERANITDKTPSKDQSECKYGRSIPRFHLMWDQGRQTVYTQANTINQSIEAIWEM